MLLPDAVHRSRAVPEKCTGTAWMQYLETASIPADWQQQPWHPWKSGTRRCTDGLKRVLKELP